MGNCLQLLLHNSLYLCQAHQKEEVTGRTVQEVWVDREKGGSHIVCIQSFV